jgi:hypothetical protein
MTIAQMPKRKPAAPDVAAERFIEGAGVRAPVTRRKPAMIRFDAMLLARVDRAAKRRGISRSAWVAFTLSKALDAEDQP